MYFLLERFVCSALTDSILRRRKLDYHASNVLNIPNRKATSAKFRWNFHTEFEDVSIAFLIHYPGFWKQKDGKYIMREIRMSVSHTYLTIVSYHKDEGNAIIRLVIVASEYGAALLKLMITIHSVGTFCDYTVSVLFN